jgi:hypothetical protein
VDVPVGLVGIEAEHSVDLHESLDFFGIDDAIRSCNRDGELRELMPTARVDLLDPSFQASEVCPGDEQPLEMGAEAMDLRSRETHRSLEVLFEVALLLLTNPSVARGDGSGKLEEQCGRVIGRGDGRGVLAAQSEEDDLLVRSESSSAIPRVRLDSAAQRFQHLRERSDLPLAHAIGASALPVRHQVGGGCDGPLLAPERRIDPGSKAVHPGARPGLGEFPRQQGESMERSSLLGIATNESAVALQLQGGRLGELPKSADRIRERSDIGQVVEWDLDGSSKGRAGRDMRDPQATLVRL